MKKWLNILYLLRYKQFRKYIYQQYRISMVESQDEYRVWKMEYELRLSLISQMLNDVYSFTTEYIINIKSL